MLLRFFMLQKFLVEGLCHVLACSQLVFDLAMLGLQTVDLLLHRVLLVDCCLCDVYQLLARFSRLAL